MLIINFQGIRGQSRRYSFVSIKKRKFFFNFLSQTQIYGPTHFPGVIALLSPKLKQEESKAYHLPSFREGLGKYGVVSPFSHISSRGCAYLRPGTILPNFAFSYPVLPSYKLKGRVTLLSCHGHRSFIG